MQICFISSYFPQPCGIASYTHYLAEALKTSNGTLDVALLAKKSNEINSSLSINILPVSNFDENFSVKLNDQLKKLNPDIVHIQHEYGIFGYDDRFLELLEELRLIGIRTVVTLHTVYTS